MDFREQLGMTPQVNTYTYLLVSYLDIHFVRGGALARAMSLAMPQENF